MTHMRTKNTHLLVIMLSLLISITPTVKADLFNVDVVDFAFDPANLTITEGDTVRWTNLGIVTHTTTANGGLWDSGNLAPGESFEFVFNTVGTFDYLCSIHPTQMQAVITVEMATDVDEFTQGSLPDGFELQPNYPNPFNPTTTIEYSLPRQAAVNITVHNQLGQKITTLVDRTQPAGSYSIEWDGTTEAEDPVASGVYFYRMQVADNTAARKMMLVK